MAGEIKKEEKKVIGTSVSPAKVTSTKTIDFPALNWGIHTGEERELPVDEQAQKEILSKEFITIIK